MTISKMCNAWAKTISDGGDTDAGKRWSSCNVYFRGRTIYSYGEHFPMAYVLAPNLVWMNGDRFSVSTGRHQSELRSAIRSHAPNAVVVIVPNTALTAANVDYKTIQPVDVKAERWEYELQTADTPPSDMQTGGTYANFGDRYHGLDEPDVVGSVWRDGSRQVVRRTANGYQWHTARHWLGDAVFTGERFTGHWANRNSESMRAVQNERVHFISSFDRQERTPLYFLSQLPGPVDTVEAAIESLAPESVKTARDIGRNVVRQGDMFAIPMDVSTRQLKRLGATFQKRRVTVTLRERAQTELAQRDALRAVTGLSSGREVNRWTKGFDAWRVDMLARFAERYPELPKPFIGDIVSLLDWRPREWDKVRTVEASPLYGTAHTATEVATLPDGRQFARGTMYHDPAVIGERRTADHRRQPLGKSWHLVARNTVPVSGTGRGRLAA